MRRGLSARHGARGQRRRPDWGACPVGRVRGHPRVHRGTWADLGAHGRTSPRRARTSGALRGPRRSPVAPVAEAAPGADGGRRTIGAACPARRGTGVRCRRPGKGAAVRGSRGAIVADAATASGASAAMQHSTGDNHENGRNPAACTQSPGAVGASVLRRMGYPAPVGRRTHRRVARAAQDCRVGDVEGGTASCQRDDVIDGQV